MEHRRQPFVSISDTLPALPNERGVTVAVVDHGVVHECGGSGRDVEIRHPPAELLEDIETIAGVALADPTSTTLNGYPGLFTSRTEGSADCGADLHLSGGGLGSPYFLLTNPAQTIVADVDGLTVFVDIWASTDAELEAWLPTGRAIVDSIQFQDPARFASEFVRPFSYSIPSADPQWITNIPELYAFVDSRDGLPVSGYGPLQASSPRGIAVMPVDELWVPVCRELGSSRVQTRITAEAFLEDLQVVSGIAFGPGSSSVQIALRRPPLPPGSTRPTCVRSSGSTKEMVAPLRELHQHERALALLRGRPLGPDGSHRRLGARPTPSSRHGFRSPMSSWTRSTSSSSRP